MSYRGEQLAELDRLRPEIQRLETELQTYLDRRATLLRELSSGPDPVNQTRLAELCGLTQPRIWKIIKG